MINLNKTLIRITFLIFFLGLFFYFNRDQVYNEVDQTSNQYLYTYSDFIDDEIKPFCNGVDYGLIQNLKIPNLNKVNLNFVDKAAWYENFFNALTSDSDIIYTKYKKRFDAKVEFHFLNGTICESNAKIRISGDFKDHLRSNLTSSLDINLEDGNIENIVKFKLFLPETKRMNTEFVTSEIMRNLGFLTPRTYKIRASINGQDEVEYIFQEKAVKEFIEFNKLRESTILETSEEYYWEKKQEINSSVPLLFGKILNTNWTNLSKFNQKISIKALYNLNKLIFQSDQSKGSFLIYDITEESYEQIRKFDAAIYALDGQHGLAIHNRKFYYDNFEKSLIPIYYDIDSQLATRDKFFQNCNDDTMYQHFSCVNNLALSASEIINQIDFNSQQIFQNLKSKNINVTKDFVDNIFNKFVINLNQMSQMGSSSFQFSENILKNFQTNYLKKINDPIIGFYYLDLNTNLLNLCDAYMEECIQTSEKHILIKNNLTYNEKVYHLTSFDITNQTNENLYKINEKVYLKDFGNSEVIIDEINKIITINIKDSKRILIFGKGVLKDWTIEVAGNLENEISEFRQDENSLTGCLTFYELLVEDIVVNSKNNNCEDAVNFLNIEGTIEEINVRNSIFDAIDIDYSKLIINEVFVDNAGNDCLDLSFSNLQFINVKNSDCGDKSISIGEKTNVVFGQTDINNSNIGVAVKDSSIVNFIETLEIMNSNNCIVMYSKKQEFGPSSLKIKKYFCESQNEDFIQLGNNFQIGS